MHRITIPIAGMHCGGCVRAVRDALARVPSVHVEHLGVGTVTLRYDPSRTTREAVLSAIVRAGYEPAAA
ncbi:MAG: heavy-metal-associated domain-containing protein [Gemmatimonadaceae bacterium]|nr:heavy-metal-associated domain-containing protein [Gemmatimonadaceae bacterium]